MRVVSAAIIVALALPAGTAVADTAQDKCIAEEKALRIEVRERCSGLSYLFNPSGCFIAQKALKKFDGEACRATKAPEQPGTEPRQSVTEAVPAPPEKTVQVEASQQPSVPELAPGPDVEQLKAENERLKAEIARLRAELEQLKK